MAYRQAILLWEPPIIVPVLQRGLEVSLVRLPDGVKHHFTNQWLDFDLNKVKEIEMAKKAKVAKVEETEEVGEQPAKAAVVGRRGRVAVTVNGQGFDSVRKAFSELELPLKQKNKTRVQLRETGFATVSHNDMEYKFVRVDKEEKEEAEPVEQEA